MYGITGDLLEVKIISILIEKRNLLFHSKLKSCYFEYDICKDMFNLIKSREITIFDEDLKNIIRKYFNNIEEVKNYIQYLSTAFIGEPLPILEDTLIERYKKRKLEEITKIDLKNTSEIIENKIKNLLDELDENEEEQGEKIDEIFDLNDYFVNDKINYIPTGLIDFDKNINGIPRQALTIIAGLPSMGKTLFATQLALNISKDYNVLFFSEEQSKIETVYKIIANLTKINSRKNLKIHELVSEISFCTTFLF